MENAIKKAGEIIRERSAFGTYRANLYCVLSQTGLDGRLTSSVITPSRADGIQWITFGTGLQSNKAKRIERDDRACVCFAADEYGIALRGRLEILTDAASKNENWYDGLANHFSGPDDPGYCVLKFHTETYSLFVDWEETVGAL